jgi:hypothetical protein
VVDCLPPWQRQDAMVNERNLEMEAEVRFAEERFLPRQCPGQDMRRIRACRDLEQQVGLRDHELDGVLHRLKW